MSEKPSGSGSFRRFCSIDCQKNDCLWRGCFFVFGESFVKSGIKLGCGVRRKSLSSLGLNCSTLCLYSDPHRTVVKKCFLLVCLQKFLFFHESLLSLVASSVFKYV